ncbi:MAG: FadR/GntR family transcriptional regulator [Hyphomicrobiales bacterium]
MVASKDSSALQASLGDELNQLGPAPAKGAFAITARLRQAIESGVFAHGDQLPPERQLTLALGTARSTIRKALDTLVQEGLVVRRVGSGTFVNYAGPIRPTSDDIADLINPLQLIEVRTAVEPAMVRLAVLNATRRDLTEIEAALDKLEASTRDPDQFTRWDIRFHLELARCSRNPLMVHIYEEINDVRAHPQWDRMKSIVLTTETMQQYNVEHRAIFGAIRDHDTVTAVDAITRHLERAKQHLIGAENADGNIGGKGRD